MGQPVAGNPTQYMIEKAFVKAGLDWRYLTLEVSPEQLPAAMAGMRAMGFRGANFTIPHKVAVIEHLDELSDAAQLMGAVNCVNRVEDRLIGDNTDGKGFVRSLREVTDPAEKSVVILGAGGAARAIAVELGLAGVAKITIVNRTPERGQPLASLLSEQVKIEAEYQPWEGKYAVSEECEILINATSIGLNDAAAMVPIDCNTLRSELIVADVVFNPPRTKFLLAAAEKNCTVVDGLGMLVNQAVIGFEIWTGVKPNAAVMREALEEFLEI
jgi:shikimate dehydrogenase